MELHYIDRSSYRNKSSADFIEQLHQQFGEFYLIPEGGSNQLALKGCAEMIEEIQQDFDHICVACGTGATLAGMISALKKNQTAHGFAVLKGAGFLRNDVQHFLQHAKPVNEARWQLHLNYHFGGYAHTNEQLWNFISEFKNDYGIELDAVYTGKMFFGLFDLIDKGFFKAGSRIIAIHTGGLQGNQGFADSTGKYWKKNICYIEYEEKLTRHNRKDAKKRKKT